MSAPAPAPHRYAAVDSALAVRRFLASVPAVVASVGRAPGAPASDPFADAAWLFVRELQVQVEGSGAAAVRLSAQGGHSSPNRHNTARFPRIQVEVSADSSRDPTTNKISINDSEMRARAVHQAIFDALHRVTGFAEVWGARGADPGVRVWESYSMGEPEPISVADWQGGSRLIAYYGISTG